VSFVSLIFGSDVMSFDWNLTEKMQGFDGLLAGNVLVGLGPFGEASWRWNLRQQEVEYGTLSSFLSSRD
jgi:hypothetical protein